ncbi:carbohydrate ABC transporter permease [Thermofilum pendens]|uniref:Binding-protein-dependent transport systems inner membrane component n=1 Tax=Thermofilum pendens (strain DSM 2475 / Hrk 5) TaxID=368408 RepID=A1S0N2_THEPD|nr:carbohydrate ABC transporter permease [Thermofilum pendens]ABL79012.1 binding-protein-dependent transport systems inner membrane component [Thermofilum pendens Hrk 5]
MGEGRKLVERLIIFAGSAILLLWIVIPTFWAFKTSISTPEEAWKPLPTKITLDNYLSLFNPSLEAILRGMGIRAALPDPMIVYIRNSLIVSLLASTIGVILGSLAGYNLARFDYKGKRVVTWLVLFAYVFPVFILIVPVLIIVRNLGLYNTLHGLALVHLAYTLPYSTLMMRSYFYGIPRVLEEAALIDGCTRFEALWRVVIPVSVPGFITAFIFSFTLSWNDLLFALVLLSSSRNYTLPIATTFFLWGGEIVDPGGLAATAIFAGLVPSVLYMLVQKYVVAGLIRGAVKA